MYDLPLIKGIYNPFQVKNQPNHNICRRKCKKKALAFMFRHNRLSQFLFLSIFSSSSRIFLDFFYSILCFMNVKRVDLNVKYYFLNVKNRRTVVLVVYTIYANLHPLSIHLSIILETIYLSQPSAIFTQIKHIHRHKLFLKYLSTTSRDSLFIDVKLQYSTVQSLIDKWNWLQFYHKKKKRKVEKIWRNHRKNRYISYYMKETK